MADQRIKSLNSDETAYFCYQLAVIINSGIPLYDGMLVFGEELAESGSQESVKIIEIVAENMAERMPLHCALEKTGVFPEYCISMIKAAEDSGKLYETLLALSEHYENESELNENIRNAVIQPLTMMIIMAAVALILIFKILPMFGAIFSEFDAAISDRINESISLSAAVGVGMLIFCGVILVFAVVFLAGVSGRDTHRSAGRFLAFFPFTRKYSRAVSLARFCEVMSMMTSCGTDIETSLEFAQGACSDPSVIKQIDECRRMISDSVPFSEAIEKCRVLPSFYARTLRVSYKSGSFDMTWKKIAERLSSEANSRLESIVSITEPLLTAALTVMAGVILLTVMMPLMNIMNSIS
ncbi:MAG: type II secretion system F family protein [Huintestinicola sp.]